jgi:hypothetical protein
MELSVEFWWNYIDRGKPKYSEKNISLVCSLRISPGLPTLDPLLLADSLATKYLSHGMATED